MNDRNVAMLKDIKQYEIWLLCTHDDHILRNSNTMRGIGGGTLGPRKPNLMEVVLWSLPHGDKAHVQLMSGESGAKSIVKAKLHAGALYICLKTRWAKQVVEHKSMFGNSRVWQDKCRGQGRPHHFNFECYYGHPKPASQDYFIIFHTGGSNCGYPCIVFAIMATRDGWAEAWASMWRLSYDVVRDALHARKPFVATTENITYR